MSNESVDDDEQQFRAFATQTEPAYLTYVTFAGNTISLLGQLVYISLSARLLFFAFFRRRRLRVDSLSTSMLIYLFTDLTCSTLGLVDGFYMVLMWRPSMRNFILSFQCLRLDFNFVAFKGYYSEKTESVRWRIREKRAQFFTSFFFSFFAFFTPKLFSFPNVIKLIVHAKVVDGLKVFKNQAWHHDVKL